MSVRPWVCKLRLLLSDDVCWRFGFGWERRIEGGVDPARSMRRSASAPRSPARYTDCRPSPLARWRVMSSREQRKDEFDVIPSVPRRRIRVAGLRAVTPRGTEFSPAVQSRGLVPFPHASRDDANMLRVPMGKRCLLAPTLACSRTELIPGPVRAFRFGDHSKAPATSSR